MLLIYPYNEAVPLNRPPELLYGRSSTTVGSFVLAMDSARPISGRGYRIGETERDSRISEHQGMRGA